jgi:hypothetical protein
MCAGGNFFYKKRMQQAACWSDNRQLAGLATGKKRMKFIFLPRNHRRILRIAQESHFIIVFIILIEHHTQNYDIMINDIIFF